jgi:hypothetical protein
MIDDIVLRELCQLIIPQSGTKFNGDDFRQLCGPQVYLFMKDNKPLYIGMTGDGLARCGSRGHKQATVARDECDEVMIYPCISRQHAERLETLLIWHLQPAYNKRKKSAYIQAMLGIGHQRATVLLNGYRVAI